jgi:hypothetical protein
MGEVLSVQKIPSADETRATFAIATAVVIKGRTKDLSI